MTSTWATGSRLRPKTSKTDRAGTTRFISGTSKRRKNDGKRQSPYETEANSTWFAMGDHSRDNVFRLILPLSRFREVEQREEKTARELLSRVGLADKARLLAGTLS